MVERDCSTQEELLAELHAGRFHAHHSLLQNNLTYFTETSLDEVAEAPA